MTFSEKSLAGRSAFVAGASSGINLGIAKGLIDQGANVALISRTAERIESAARSIDAGGKNSLALVADVRDFDAVEAAINIAADTFGDLDIVVSGAAGNFLAPSASLSSNGFRTVVEIDLIGTFNVFRASYARLHKPGASLVAISAPQGERAVSLQAGACAAKAGINMLVRVLAKEWGPDGIRVNAISPGPIAGTEGMARLAPNSQAEAAVISSVPLRKFGSVENIADMTVFLASKAADYVTGHVLSCDGGFVLAN